jgi:cation diffusion facilitator CzcD-associated flavoprotein CzcO
MGDIAVRFGCRYGARRGEKGVGVESTSLVVVGAGPYGVAVAAQAIERGIDTVVFGRPMSFWTDHMPSGMFLRSGPDWHLDASETHTLEAFLEEREIATSDVDPVPIEVSIEYATWFQQRKGVVARDELVCDIVDADGRFELSTESGRAHRGGPRRRRARHYVVPGDARVGADRTATLRAPYL